MIHEGSILFFRFIIILNFIERQEIDSGNKVIITVKNKGILYLNKGVQP